MKVLTLFLTLAFAFCLNIVPVQAAEHDHTPATYVEQPCADVTAEFTLNADSIADYIILFTPYADYSTTTDAECTVTAGVIHYLTGYSVRQSNTGSKHSPPDLPDSTPYDARYKRTFSLWLYFDSNEALVKRNGFEGYNRLPRGGLTCALLGSNRTV